MMSSELPEVDVPSNAEILSQGNSSQESQINAPLFNATCDTSFETCLANIPEEDAEHNSTAHPETADVVDCTEMDALHVQVDESKGAENEEDVRDDPSQLSTNNNCELDNVTVAVTSEVDKDSSDPRKKLYLEISKDRTIVEDIQNALFALSINPKGRKGKVREMKEEEFDLELYVRNTSGFTTSRPVKWSMALEKYIDQNKSTRCRWGYKKEESGVYSEANLLLYFDNTKRVDLKINYTIGSLMIQGERYKSWITSEFPKVQQLFDEIQDSPEEKIEENARKSASTGINRETTNYATASDIDLVWEKVDEMTQA